METQVLKENNLATGGLVHGLLDILADTLLGEDDAPAKELLKLGDDGLQAVLGVLLAVGTTKVGHQDHRLGAVADGILDGGESTDNTLVVGDLLVLVERDVEVDLCAQCVSLWILVVNWESCSMTYADQDTLVLQVDVGDGELAGERHCD